MPKASYSVLAVTPDNLVGTCRDCNFKKRERKPTCEADTPIHPYFDDLSDERWLAGTVISGAMAAIIFSVRHVGTWSKSLNSRVQKQFNELELGSLYASQTAREISALKTNLPEFYEAGGAQGVRKELRCRLQFREKAYGINSWQAVAYRALSDSDWYCNCGFRM